MIKAGEFVTCPVCKKRLLRVKIDIVIGDLIVAELFDAVDEYPNPENGQDVIPHCGQQPIQTIFVMGIIVGSLIHVGDVWKGMP